MPFQGFIGAMDLPITKCDLSGGPNNGTIYVNWSDQRNGSNDTDVWLSKSTDGGDTWTSPVRVNDDPVQERSVFTWMDIDQTNGNLHLFFTTEGSIATHKRMCIWPTPPMEEIPL